jgi:hypothetical protein
MQSLKRIAYYFLTTLLMLTMAIAFGYLFAESMV